MPAPGTEKVTWGAAFEDWEQFFWEHRDPDVQPVRDAGPGLDEFFRWVAICQLLAGVPAADKAPALADELLRASTPELTRRVLFGVASGGMENTRLGQDRAQAARERLQLVGRYVAAVRWLYDEWRPSAQAEAAQYWGITAEAAALPLPALEWLHATKPLQLGAYLRLLPVLAWLVGRQSTGVAVTGVEVFRAVRYFYNLSQAERGEKSEVDAIRQGHLLSAASADIADLPTLAMQPTVDPEQAKLNLFRVANTRVLAEKLCWALEDEKQNAGEIRHLCVNPATLSYDELATMARNYDVLFGRSTNRQQLQTLLLSFGEYQRQVSRNPEYVRYDFGDWKRIVRSKTFRAFFAQLPAAPLRWSGNSGQNRVLSFARHERQPSTY